MSFANSATLSTSKAFVQLALQTSIKYGRCIIMNLTPDNFIQRLLRLQNTKEAREWLEGSTRVSPRTLGEDGSTTISKQLVEEIYAAGAVQVWAVEIDSYDKGENTGKLVIELPKDARDREMILRIIAKVAESQGFEPEPDMGQCFVFVMLD